MKSLILLFAVIMIGVPLYAIPATLTLKGGVRSGLEPLSISQAAEQLSASGISGMDLVEAARSLVAERMVYSRRNSFDHSSKAFYRGYGYCQQHSFALQQLLEELGFKARVVQALRNQFPNGVVTAHSWVEVEVDGETLYVDSLFYRLESSELDFTPLAKITGFPLWFRVLAGWGSTAVNAHRYYVTGKDL